MNPSDIVLLNKVDYLKTPPSTDFNELCRLCLQIMVRSEDVTSKSINDEYYNMTIKSLIEMYTFLKIPGSDEEDNLPTNICLKCADFLIEIHTFRSRCYFYNDILLKLTNYKQDEQVESDNEEIPSRSDTPLPLVEEDVSPVIPAPLGAFENISMKISDGKLGIHRCKHCREVFHDRPSLVKHCCKSKPRKKIPRKEKMCFACGKFVERRTMASHMRIHSGNMHACKECDYRTIHLANLRRHQMVHTGEKPFVCAQCGHATTQLVFLQKHEKTHARMSPEASGRVGRGRKAGIGGFIIINGKQSQLGVCSDCRLGFVDRESYDKHIDTNHKPQDSNQTLKICQRTLREQKRGHLNDKPFTCTKCGKVWNSRTLIINHMSRHINERLYDCKSCSKSFPTAHQLIAHTRVHTGEKSYVCRVCKRTFRQNTHLVYHMRTHSGEKSYVCDVCGRGFALNANLIVHKRIHTGEKPYPCRVCSKAFRDTSNRKKHEQTHHGNEVLQEALAKLNVEK